MTFSGLAITDSAPRRDEQNGKLTDNVRLGLRAEEGLTVYPGVSTISLRMKAQRKPFDHFILENANTITMMVAFDCGKEQDADLNTAGVLVHGEP